MMGGREGFGVLGVGGRPGKQTGDVRVLSGEAIVGAKREGVPGVPDPEGLGEEDVTCLIEGGEDVGDGCGLDVEGWV